MTLVESLKHWAEKLQTPPGSKDAGRIIVTPSGLRIDIWRKGLGYFRVVTWEKLESGPADETIGSEVAWIEATLDHYLRLRAGGEGDSYRRGLHCALCGDLLDYPTSDHAALCSRCEGPGRR